MNLSYYGSCYPHPKKEVWKKGRKERKKEEAKSLLY